MSASDIGSWVSALAAAGAFAVAAYQLASLRRDAVASRAAEIQAVAFETDVLVRPEGVDAREGRSRWVYDFSVVNPGRLPVTNVQVTLSFKVPVIREHSDKSHDKPTRQLDMFVPVVAAGGRKAWRRTLLIHHAERRRLRQTLGAVEFTTPDAGRVQTVWPNEPNPRTANRRLLRRLRELGLRVGPTQEVGGKTDGNRPSR